MTLRQFIRARNGISAGLLFGWRMARNLLCILPLSRRWLFPQQVLASSFGSAELGYAWEVFLRHQDRLRKFGFAKANRVLEVGPGRNLGTGLLWWVSIAALSGEGNTTVVLWDVYPNAHVEQQRLWEIWAEGLLESLPSGERVEQSVLALLQRVARGDVTPSIRYEVCAVDELRARFEPSRFDLVYSQAALEHVWDIRCTWEVLVSLTASRGWHSHRIDLADHGQRETNYTEMLEWSPLAYWLTMRFIPGATNRWRAADHLAFLRKSGFNVFSAELERRSALAGRRTRLAKPFRHLDDAELRTTAIDVVARYE
jgi:hypothetical protein